MQQVNIVFQGKVKELQIVARYPTMDDIEVLQQFINEASAERTFISLQGETFSFEEEAQYLESVLTKIEVCNAVKLMVFAGEELLAVGDVTRMKASTCSHVASLGIIVAKAARGKGIGKKLMELLINESRDKLPGIEMIILSVYQQNEIARKLYASLGFKEYGRLPNGRKRGSEYDDEIEMYLPITPSS